MERSCGVIQLQLWIWVGPVIVRHTPVFHKYLHTTDRSTSELPLCHRDNGVASPHFLWKQSLRSSLFLWITYCQNIHTHTHILCYLPSQPVLLPFFFFFPAPLLMLANPWHVPHFPHLAPLGALSVWRWQGPGYVCLSKKAPFYFSHLTYMCVYLSGCVTEGWLLWGSHWGMWVRFEMANSTVNRIDIL